MESEEENCEYGIFVPNVESGGCGTRPTKAGTNVRIKDGSFCGEGGEAGS